MTEDVTDDQNPIRLTPVGQVTRRVSWRFENLESTHHIAFLEDFRNRVRRARHPTCHPGSQTARISKQTTLISGLNRVTVTRATQEWNAQSLAHEVRRSLMVAVTMSEGVSSDAPA